MGKLYDCDKVRYRNAKMPKFQKYLRLCQDAKNPLTKQIYRTIYRMKANKSHIEISSKSNIGYGLYIGHPYCIKHKDNATEDYINNKVEQC